MNFKIHHDFSKIFKSEPVDRSDPYFYRKYEDLLLNAYITQQNPSEDLLHSAQKLYDKIDEYAKRFNSKNHVIDLFVPDFSLQDLRHFFSIHHLSREESLKIDTLYSFVIGAVFSVVKDKIDVQGLELPSDVLVHAAAHETFIALGAENYPLSDQAIDEIGKRAAQFAAKVSTQILNETQEKQRRILNIIESSIERHSNIEQATQEISSHCENLRTVVDDITPKVAFITSKLQELENQGNSIKQTINTHSSKVLWETNYNSHWCAFFITSSLIAVAVLAPFIIALCATETIHSIFTTATNLSRIGLPENATDAQVAAASFSRIAIIAAPVLLYVWGLKLLIRFQMRSLALMDDANQRRATMDTYFHLLEHDKASTEERALMLNALFRPLPGQNNDNVEPPNYIDLVKDKVLQVKQ